jgi:hypothetical protein
MNDFFKFNNIYNFIIVCIVIYILKNLIFVIKQNEQINKQTITF